MSPWLFDVYVDGVVRQVNVGVLVRGLALLGASGGRFEMASCYSQIMQHWWLTQERGCVDW